MTPQEELLDQLRDERARSEVLIHETADEYFTLIGDRFPVAGSKIDWDHVPKSIVRCVSTEDIDRYLNDADQFLAEVLSAEHLDKDQLVVVVNDRALEVALTMSLRTLVVCLRRILCVPQHTYVVAVDGAWCMAFTMEGDLCFGFAPSRA